MRVVDPRSPTRNSGAAGSALVMAMFVLALLTGMGAALLFLSQTETRMSRASLRTRQAFYLAEAGVEDGRITLYNLNVNEDLDDELAAAGGADDLIDFLPANLRVTYDSSGNPTGLTGFDDDVPLRGWTQLTDSTTGETGWYAAFLNNDPLEGMETVDDINVRVLVTGVGVGADSSTELAQAIVEPYRYLPPTPPAALTLLGPLPSYDNGNSNAQSHTGYDCGSSIGPFAPIIGTIGGAATAQVQSDMNRPDSFGSGPFSGQDTVGDLDNPLDPIVAAAGNGTIDPTWLDCQALKQIVRNLSINADYYCNTDVSACSIPSTSGPDDIVVIDGDLTNTPNGSFSGFLLVTGELTYHGNTGWNGVVMVVGEGSVVRTGGGNGQPSGGVVVANIDPSPDGPNVNKSDWCSTGTDGFARASYNTSGGGSSEVEWCSTSVTNANSVRTYRVVEFVQR